MKVSVVDLHGIGAIINAFPGDRIVKLRRPGQVILEDGAVLRVSFDVEHLHLFDDAGKRL